MGRYNKAWQSAGVGGLGGAAITFFWNAFMPEYPMSPEVAAFTAGLIAALANRFMPANAS